MNRSNENLIVELLGKELNPDLAKRAADKIQELEQRLESKEEDVEVSMAKLWALVLLILGLSFLFYGSPDVYDVLHQKMLSL